MASPQLRMEEVPLEAPGEAPERGQERVVEMLPVAVLEMRAVRRWIELAVGSLLIAGLFALFLVVARTPLLSSFVTDPLFFKRCLVVHVNLSLVVWFYAYLGGLYTLLPSRQPVRGLGTLGHRLSLLGVLTLMAGAAVSGAQPILSNYIPVIDHELFLAGLALFGGGLMLNFLDGRLLPGREVREGLIDLPAAARPGLRAAAIAFLLALVTLVASALTLPEGIAVELKYELLFWGAGHVLQFASEAAMMAVWLILLTSALGRPVMSRNTASILFGLLILPVMGAPLLAMEGAASANYRVGFMRLMQFGIFPVVTVFLLLCLRALRQARREGLPGASLRDPRVSGFAVSATLCVVGFVLGAMIRGSNTMVPAHYHAAIGAVTASFMAVTYLLLEPLGMALPGPRLRKLAVVQPALFGVGQAVFAVGFGLAGAHGMARKAYGPEQQVRSLAETLGLGVMGLGGLVAVAGGLVFLWIVGAAMRQRISDRAVRTRRSLWLKNPVPSRPSNG